MLISIRRYFWCKSDCRIPKKNLYLGLSSSNGPQMEHYVVLSQYYWHRIIKFRWELDQILEERFSEKWSLTFMSDPLPLWKTLIWQKKNQLKKTQLGLKLVLLVLRERPITDVETVRISINVNADSPGSYNALHEEPMGKHLHVAIVDFRTAVSHHDILPRLLDRT